MTLLSLTFDGTYLELAGWIGLGLIYLAGAFGAGWLWATIRADRDDR